MSSGHHASNGKRHCKGIACAECGETFVPRVTVPGQRVVFCSTRCRRRWHSRVDRRGRQLYHTFMDSRYRRKDPKAASIGTANSLAALWRAEDKAAGRRSYDHRLIPEVIARPR